MLYEIDQVCFIAGIAYSKAELRYYLQHPKAVVLVAEDDQNVIAGFCIAQKYMQEGRHLGHIVTIDVLPAARRLGTGRILMQAAEERLREDSVVRVRLEVAVDNQAAQAFYQHLGFAVTGKIPGYYLGRLDAWVMEKQLGAS
jgi:ribosomal-protein-alanine N-acetyltransferase